MPGGPVPASRGSAAAGMRANTSGNPSPSRAGPLPIHLAPGCGAEPAPRWLRHWHRAHPASPGAQQHPALRDRTLSLTAPPILIKRSTNSCGTPGASRQPPTVLPLARVPAQLPPLSSPPGMLSGAPAPPPRGSPSTTPSLAPVSAQLRRDSGRPLPVPSAPWVPPGRAAAAAGSPCRGAPAAPSWLSSQGARLGSPGLLSPPLAAATAPGSPPRAPAACHQPPLEVARRRMEEEEEGEEEEGGEIRRGARGCLYRSASAA